MSREVQSMFSEIASTYDVANRLMSLRIDLNWRERAIRSLLKFQPQKILDLCAGTMDLTAAINRKAPECEIVACDFSLNMLREGFYKVVNGKTKIVCGDGHKLPFADASFDAIICGFGIRNLEDREQAISEIHRVLKKSGHLIILEFFKPNNSIAKIFYGTYGRYILPTLGGIISKKYSAYRYLFESIQDFMSTTEYQDLLKQYQFQTLECKALSGGVAHLLVAEAM